MYESEFQEYKAQRIKVRNQYFLDFLLSKDVEVKSPTSSSDKNMLGNENIYNNNHVIESYNWIMTNMWKSDGRLDHVTTESYNLGYKGIGNADHRSLITD